MDLRFGGARADRAPAHQIGEELRSDRVEEFAAGGHAFFGEIAEQAATFAQTFIDREGSVEVRVVDQALPADGGEKDGGIEVKNKIEAILGSALKANRATHTM